MIINRNLKEVFDCVSAYDHGWNRKVEDRKNEKKYCSEKAYPIK